LFNTTVVAFKVLSLGSYAPMPAPSPPFKIILELVLWNGLQNCCCITPDVINVIKMPSFQYFLYLREQKKKSLRTRSGEYMKWLTAGNRNIFDIRIILRLVKKLQTLTRRFVIHHLLQCREHAILFLVTHFRVTLTSRARTFNMSLLFFFPYQNSVGISILHQMCYIAQPPYLPRFFLTEAIPLCSIKLCNIYSYVIYVTYI